MNESLQTQESTPEAVEEKVYIEEKKEGASKKGLVLGLLVVLIIGGIVFGLYKAGVIGGMSSNEVGSADPESIVATVNGITITRGELDKKLEQVKKTLPENAVDTTQDAAFELQLLNDLISLKLLTQMAEEKRYTVSEEQLAAEKTTLVEQLGGEEALKMQLDAMGISQEELDENMRNELLIRQLLDEETTIKDVTVTDQEIQDAYDAVIASGSVNPDEAPSLDQVREIVRTDIVNQKSAEIIQKYIEEKKATAQIEITL